MRVKERKVFVYLEFQRLVLIANRLKLNRRLNSTFFLSIALNFDIVPSISNIKS